MNGANMRIKEMREKRGMTQAELADKAGISIRSLQAYEQGFKSINRAAAITVYRLAQALRCAPEDVLELPEQLTKN